MGKRWLAVVLLVALLSGCAGPQTPTATPTPSTAQAALGPGGTESGYTAALMPDWIISRDGGWYIDTVSLFDGMTAVEITNDLTHVNKTLDGDAAAKAAAAMGDVRLTSFRGRVVEAKAGYEWGLYDRLGSRGISDDGYSITVSLSRDEYEFVADKDTLQAVSKRLQSIFDGSAK